MRGHYVSKIHSLFSRSYTMAEKIDIRESIEQMAPWFHNIHLPDGNQTAPDHFLGDFPAFKWQQIKNNIPDDLTGKTALDIGCNAGFYSLELAKRGAEVTAIDLDTSYLKQAEWVIDQFGLENKITLKQQQVYDLAHEDQIYDIVWFMGVFYHLRYPLLALDILATKTREILVFQTLTMPGSDVFEPGEDYDLNDRNQILQEGWPKMAFIEKKFNDDPTNWWFANKSCILAMLRTCGFKVFEQPGDEVYLCRPDPENEGVSRTWNESEYLSAINRDWSQVYQKKIK